MDWLTDEILFYAGAAAAGSSIILAVIYALLAQVSKTRLNYRLEKEYGRDDYRKSKNKKKG